MQHRPEQRVACERACGAISCSQWPLVQSVIISAQKNAYPASERAAQSRAISCNQWPLVQSVSISDHQRQSAAITCKRDAHELNRECHRGPDPHSQRADIHAEILAVQQPQRTRVAVDEPYVKAISGTQWHSVALSGPQRRLDALRCAQRHSVAISGDWMHLDALKGNWRRGLYPDGEGNQHACKRPLPRATCSCTNGEGNQHACKRTCIEAEQLEPPASATCDHIGLLWAEGRVPCPQLEVQRADLMRRAIRGGDHSGSDEESNQWRSS